MRDRRYVLDERNVKSCGLKDEEIYNIFDTEKLLGRPASVAVDAHSGLAGIAHWINAALARGGHTARFDKKDPVIAQSIRLSTRLRLSRIKS